MYEQVGSVPGAVPRLLDLDNQSLNFHNNQQISQDIKEPM